MRFNFFTKTKTNYANFCLFIVLLTALESIFFTVTVSSGEIRGQELEESPQIPVNYSDRLPESVKIKTIPTTRKIEKNSHNNFQEIEAIEFKNIPINGTENNPNSGKIEKNSHNNSSQEIEAIEFKTLPTTRKEKIEDNSHNNFQEIEAIEVENIPINGAEKIEGNSHNNSSQEIEAIEIENIPINGAEKIEGNSHNIPEEIEAIELENIPTTGTEKIEDNSHNNSSEIPEAIELKNIPTIGTEKNQNSGKIESNSNNNFSQEIEALEIENIPTTGTEKNQNSGKIENNSDNNSSEIPEALEVENIPTKKRGNNSEVEFIEIDPNSTDRVEFLNPKDAEFLDRNSTTVTIKYPVYLERKLLLNGQELDPVSIGRTELNAETQSITETWYGVIFEEGENTLTIQTTLDEEEQPDVSVKVTVSGLPTKLKIDTVESRIPADGRSVATIEGQFYDANGNFSKYDNIVTLFASGGKFIGEDFKDDIEGFQVEVVQGKFTAKLQANTKPQVVRIAAHAIEIDAFTQIKFTNVIRPTPLISGFADLRIGTKGTNYYSEFQDFLIKNPKDETELDFTSGAFATGNIGNWTFIGAYRSDRSLNEDVDGENRLFRSYQPSELDYPLYGDSSDSEIVAPSIDSFYLRFERSSFIENADTDYIMWGDYNTEEFATSHQRFTSFTRQLHGFKGNYNIGNLQFTGFFANNIAGFQRDTILPDGTSGIYFLSRRGIVRGSENIFIESEEFLRPGTIVERKRLTRIVDYEIDYDRGTIVFTNPVLRTDLAHNGATLARRIVATYQFESHENNETDLYGGKVRYHISRNPETESSIGATYLRENKGDRDFELYGADAVFSITPDSKAILEYAHSNNHSAVMGNFVDGNAYRAEIEGTIYKGIRARAYYRSAEEGFSNNATTSFVPGQTRYGTELLARIFSGTNFKFQYDREDNFGITPTPLTQLEEFLSPTQNPILGSSVDNDVTTVTVGLQQKISIANLGIDWVYRDRSDTKADTNVSSSQLRSNLIVPVTDRLTFKAINETTLSSNTDAVFGDRTVLSATWEVFPKIEIGIDQQWFTRGQFAGKSFTNFSISGDRDLWTNANLAARYSIAGGMDGAIIGTGTIGLNQKLNLAPGLRVDLGYEHTFNSFGAGGKNNPAPQLARALAVGQSNAILGVLGGSSYNLGVEYTGLEDLKASAKLEYRDSSSSSSTNITANVAGKISPALTALLSFDRFSVANPSLNLDATTKLRVGLAYRHPDKDKFNALLRYEYRENPATIPDTILFGSGTGTNDHVFAAEGIYAPSWRWEFYGKFALRDATTFLAEDFDHHSTVSLAQIRALYRFAYRWDIAGEGRIISQPSANYHENGLSLEFGFYPVSDLRISAGYAFGSADDRDFTGYRSKSGPYLGVTVKLNGLFDSFGQPKLTPPPAEAKERLENPQQFPPEENIPETNSENLELSPENPPETNSENLEIPRVNNLESSPENLELSPENPPETNSEYLEIPRVNNLESSPENLELSPENYPETNSEYLEIPSVN